MTQFLFSDKAPRFKWLNTKKLTITSQNNIFRCPLHPNAVDEINNVFLRHRIHIFVLASIKTIMRNKFFILIVTFLIGPGSTYAQPIFVEEQGILRVDVESAEPFGQWILRDALTGFIGDNYLEFEGPNFFNNPGNSLLSYKVRITTPGTYLFRWHSRITEPDENTEFNDSWLRFPDADLVFGERNGSQVFPHGSGMTPTPEGSGRDNWLKVYQNRRNEWFWGGFTSDNDPHDIFAEFNSPGDYTIEISGRSTGHAIDRFVLVHSSATLSSAQNLSEPESDRITSSVAQLEPQLLHLSPNPVSDVLQLRFPADFRAGRYTITIADLTGKTYRQLDRQLTPAATLQLAVDDLTSGAYLIVCEAGNQRIVGKFLK